MENNRVKTKTSSLPLVKINTLFLAYIAFVLLGLPIGLLGVAWPTMRADFSLALDTIGALFIATTVGYLVSSFTIGRLINRFGIGPLLILSSLLSAVAFFGYAAAPAWSVIVALGVIGGFGSGIIDAGLNTYLASEYGESQMQWLHASFGIGAILSPLMMTASLALFASWRPAYFFMSCLLLILTICFVLTLSAWKRPQRHPAESVEGVSGERSLMDYKTSLWRTLFRIITWLSILMFLLYTGAEFTLADWTYTLFTEGRGVSPQLAGLWAAGFWTTFTLGRILAGVFAHRIRLNTLLVGGMLLALLGAVLFWWNPLQVVGVAGVFLIGFAMAPIFPGLISNTSQRVGQRYAANTIGIQLSAAAFGAALLPTLAGALAVRFSLEAITVMLIFALFGLLALYLLSLRTKWAE